MLFTRDIDDDAAFLGLTLTDEEKEQYANDIYNAAECKSKCQNCTKQGHEILNCLQHLVFRDDNGRLTFRYVFCDKRSAYIARVKVARLLKTSNVGSRFANRQFSNFDITDANKKAFEACNAWVVGYKREGKGIFLTGDVGTGKTHLAAAMLHKLIEKGIPAVMVVVPDLLRELREGYKSGLTGKIFDAAKTVEVLVLDDFGAERIVSDNGSSWAQEQLFMLINYRYEHALPVIITSNDSIGELEQKVGKRITSRLWEMTKGYKLTGDDYRKRGDR